MMTIVLGQGTTWHQEGLHMGTHWLWWAFWVVALALVAWLVVRLLANREALRKENDRLDRGEEVLRERFARGEIDEDELVERLTTLQSSRRVGPR